jgi:hypothetical protein
LLQQIEQAGIFSWIRDLGYAYPVLLWLHLIAVCVWAGMMLVTNFHALGWGSWSSDATSQRVKWTSFLLAALCGGLLFGAHAGQYAYNPWFWWKLLLLVILAAVSYVPINRTKLVAALSLTLWMGAILAARGPATIRDLMHSMIDPSAEFLFESVQILEDKQGLHEIAPQTDEDWRQVRARAEVLLGAPELLTASGRRAARPRDRAANPEVELETADLQKLLQTKQDDFALRAKKLHEAVSIVLRAIDAKDKTALLNALNTIDQACESCHVRYWYPNDQQAVQAAKEDGLLE